MTHPALTCEQFADSLADFLERDVAEATRASMEGHAMACDDCGPLLADLRRLRLDAANLPELSPSRDLWSGIATRIETRVVELPNRSSLVARRSSRVWMGLAAAGLIAVTATVTYRIARRDTTTAVPVATSTVAVLWSPKPDKVDSVVPTPRSTAAPAATRLVSNTKPTAEQTFDSEISRLRKVVDARKSKLDTATVSVIEKNLAIIDDAIAQCRAALHKDPASQYLNESLNDALDNKVQLLRTAATLPVRM
jgi:hypothetical protein